MRTEPKASYQTVQNEYVYGYTPIYTYTYTYIYIYIYLQAVDYLKHRRYIQKSTSDGVKKYIQCNHQKPQKTK